MNFSATFPSCFEFDLWVPDDDDDVMKMQDEELSASSHEEATKVFEQWQTEEEEMNTLMQVDDQLGSDLLDDTIFGATSAGDDDCCLSPVGPIEELVLVSLDDEDMENFFMIPAGIPCSNEDSSSSSYSDHSYSYPASPSPPPSSPSLSLEFDDQYKATLRKLAESMKRSHETRKSLIMKTPKTERYARSMSVSGVISSTEKSSEQLQAYLQNIRV